MRYEVKVATGSRELEQLLNDRTGEKRLLTVLTPSGVKDPAWVVFELEDEPKADAEPEPQSSDLGPVPTDDEVAKFVDSLPSEAADKADETTDAVGE